MSRPHAGTRFPSRSDWDCYFTDFELHRDGEPWLSDVRDPRNRSASDPRSPRADPDCNRERKTMRMKAIGWVVGSLGPLLGAGAAWGNQQMESESKMTPTGADVSGQS